MLSKMKFTSFPYVLTAGLVIPFVIGLSLAHATSLADKAASLLTGKPAAAPLPSVSPAVGSAGGLGATPPDPSSNPVLARILESGAKLYYMGNLQGLDGWFILKDGQVQIIYTTPDNVGGVIGAMFGPDGANISAAQVQNVVIKNPELEKALGMSAQEQQAFANAGVVAQAPMTPLPSISMSPGERLVQSFAEAKGVIIGDIGAPEIYMVMSPDCPHCQATWRALRDEVFKKTLRVHFIPIGTPDTDEERAAAILLHVKDPLNAWDKYVEGDLKQLAGTPDATAIAETRSNHVLIDTWSIHATPYLAYRGRDGKIKVLQGEPEKISSVLDDLK